MNSLYPNTFYRVSVKALVKNNKSEVLVVKERNDTWDLPGGGLDHGETPSNGLKREVKEELGIEEIQIDEIINIRTMFIERKNSWLMWVVYKVSLKDHNFRLADDVTDQKFINPLDLLTSSDPCEQAIGQIANDLKMLK